LSQFDQHPLVAWVRRLDWTWVAALSTLEALLVASLVDFFFEGVFPEIFLFWFVVSLLVYGALKLGKPRDPS
jgi:hypothetical protein